MQLERVAFREGSVKKNSVSGSEESEKARAREREKDSCSRQLVNLAANSGTRWLSWKSREMVRTPFVGKIIFREWRQSVFAFIFIFLQGARLSRFSSHWQQYSPRKVGVGGSWAQLLQLRSALRGDPSCMNSECGVRATLPPCLVIKMFGYSWTMGNSKYGRTWGNQSHVASIRVIFAIAVGIRQDWFWVRRNGQRRPFNSSSSRESVLCFFCHIRGWLLTHSRASFNFVLPAHPHVRFGEKAFVHDLLWWDDYWKNVAQVAWKGNPHDIRRSNPLWEKGIMLLRFL